MSQATHNLSSIAIEAIGEASSAEVVLGAIDRAIYVFSGIVFCPKCGLEVSGLPPIDKANHIVRACGGLMAPDVARAQMFRLAARESTPDESNA